MIPVARESLSPALAPFGESSTLPSEAYADEGVFRWELEYFFDRTWVCVGRADDPQAAGDQRAMRLVEWHGWLFANASGDAPPFEEHVGNLGELIENHRPEELLAGARHTYEVQANWKILVENYHECYHCSVIHPELTRVSPPTSSVNLEPEGAWVGGPMLLADGTETMSLDGRSRAPRLPHLEKGQERKIYYFGLFPNLLISVHPDYVLTHRLQPLAPERTAVECEWLFSREALDSEGFDPSYAREFWDITNRQDWGACEGVQRGISSRGYRQGPLSPREDAVYQFITMVARGYLEGEVSRPATRA
jgi:Rieske 2Fe-2S family protein